MLLTGKKLRELRKNAGITLREAASLAEIDFAILSKMERGERKLNRKLVIKLSQIYNTDTDELITQYLADKIVYELKGEELAGKALKVAESEIKYNTSARIPLTDIIKKIQIVFKKDKRVLKAWLFGSYLNDDFKTDSDIDIMLKLSKEPFSLFDFADIKYNLEKALNINTDIVEEGCLSLNIEKSEQPIMKLIYER